MSKRDLTYKAMQMEAMFHILNETDIYFHRKICRWYSEKFHTPLHLVMDGSTIAWQDVLLHYYETQFEDIGYNNVYELACQDYVPELAEHFEQENEDFAKALEAEQLETLEKKQKQVSNKVLKADKSSQNDENSQDQADKPAPPAPIKMSFDDTDEEI